MAKSLKEVGTDRQTIGEKQIRTTVHDEYAMLQESERGMQSVVVSPGYNLTTVHDKYAMLQESERGMQSVVVSPGYNLEEWVMLAQDQSLKDVSTDRRTTGEKQMRTTVRDEYVMLQESERGMQSFVVSPGNNLEEWVMLVQDQSLKNLSTDRQAIKEKPIRPTVRDAYAMCHELERGMLSDIVSPGDSLKALWDAIKRL